MAKPPVSGHNSNSDNLSYQTWTLRVSIHCDGCKKKVFKVLQNIDGVYKTVIDPKQNKVMVTGSVDGDTLVQKLLKANKHAEILPESFEATAAVDNASGGSKKKKKKQQSDKPNEGDQGVTIGDNDGEHVDDGKKETEVATADGNDGGKDQVQAQPTVADSGGNGNGNGGGGGKKKKKKKGKGVNNNNAPPPNGDSEGVPTGNAPADTGSTSEHTENVEIPNLSPPRHQMVYATPYDIPPFYNCYPPPAYGMSYSTTYPSTESSYYAPPVYGYAQSHPSAYYPLAPPLPSYCRSAFDDHDDENDERRGCTIM